MRYRNHNKILLAPPKKKMPFLIKWGVIALFTALAGWSLSYFIFDNDLVNFPYFPSSLILYTNLSLAWISAIAVGTGFVIFFMMISSEWIKIYRQQKLIQFSLAAFLWISAIGLGIFFGSASKDIAYTSLNAIFSQLALHTGTMTGKQGHISETHTANSFFQQEIQVKRGKVMARIIDPVSYKFNIKLSFDGKAHPLDLYCYSGSADEPILKTPEFKVSGTESIFGFRCTSGCELYRYFEVKENAALSLSNFSACSKIYPKQPSL